MTASEAEARVRVVAATAGDDEAAHAAEDSFREDVLRAIASGAPDPGLLAAIALRTGLIKFSRWCA